MTYDSFQPTMTTFLITKGHKKAIFHLSSETVEAKENPYANCISPHQI